MVLPFFKERRIAAYLLKQERVCAKRDKPLLRNQPLNDLADLAVDERLAAGNGNHRRAAFLGCVQAFLHR